MSRAATLLRVRSDKLLLMVHGNREIGKGRKIPSTINREPAKVLHRMLGESSLSEPQNIPNGRLIIESIGLSRERLTSGAKSKVAVPAQLLRELLSLVASTLPFDLDFYLATYPDIRQAHEAGRIADPRRHFIEEGYIEGRFGSKPKVHEDFYKSTYPDVKSAIASGVVPSALDHYLRAGAFEGRFANSESVECVKRWLAILGRE
jgi:hypothetical protein